jgi:hypothetical protein
MWSAQKPLFSSTVHGAFAFGKDKREWGKQPKRRLWRMKRGCFEEVSRLADP